jgi:pilus assembly protein Flp/PilA
MAQRLRLLRASRDSGFSYATFCNSGETRMKQLLLRLWREEEGQDLTEYALLLVLLTLAAVGSLGALANAINGVFVNVAGNLNTTT